VLSSLTLRVRVPIFLAEVITERSAGARTKLILLSRRRPSQATE
jgi:hypothetical protein